MQVWGEGRGTPTLLRRIIVPVVVGSLFVCFAAASGRSVSAEEPPAINPFGPVHQERDDAVPGYVELSDGTIYYGKIYMTRDKRLKIYDESLKRQREIPLNRVSTIEAKVVKEWMEKEWRFKELALNEKQYTGRSYPTREYVHTITLDDGRKITGPLAELICVEAENMRSPGDRGTRLEPIRVILHKRDKGEFGEDLKSLVYVKLIKLGEEAYEEGKKKASASRRVPSRK
ncbi:MAG: hypothetical protein D6741_04005 [Planctomycetota bacterium]|nr:MAG: hypothetical protein D6741_04005 [Planctomycetota bacterium]